MAALSVDKTSRSMAQQLKMMEENRKKKAQEEEGLKREQQKLKRVQAVVDQLKGTREFLYKLGSKAAKGALEVFLASRADKGKKARSSEVGEGEEGGPHKGHAREVERQTFSIGAPEN